MKTPEDEAFDDLARKQGMWGGGFTAKRQAAMDKINTEFHEEYIKYRTAFPKEYTAPQPAQEPTSGDYALGYAEGFNDACKKPAQEPVAWMYQCTADNSGAVLLRHKTNWAESNSGLWIETPLYTAPPQREWVGLTDAEIDEGNKQSWVTKQAWESAVWWASEKLKEKNI